MSQKETSLEDYIIDREYASRITLEEFVRRMIRSHADTDAPEADPEKPRTAERNPSHEP